MRPCLVLPVLLLGCLLYPTRAAADPAQPTLELEVGMHLLPITSLGTDAQGRWLVTGSRDRTVRIWDLGSGALVQTLRLPHSSYAPTRVSLSADGQTVGLETFWNGMASGEFHRISRQSGALEGVRGLLAVRRTLGGFRQLPLPEPYAGQHGAYWDHGESRQDQDVDGQGRLVGATLWLPHRGKRTPGLQLFSAELQRQTETELPSDAAPCAVRFSPDGSKLAVGYRGKPFLEVRASPDLSLLYHPDTSGVEGELCALTWSADGKSLCAGGTWVAAGQHPIRCFAAGGQPGSSFRDVSAAEQTILDIIPLPQGGVAYGTEDPGWGVLSASGERARWLASPLSRFRGSPLRVDASGETVLFSSGQGAVSFSTRDLALIQDPPPDDRLRPPRITHPEWAVLNWKDSRSVQLNGRSWDPGPGQLVRSLAIAPDGRFLILGATEVLTPVLRDRSSAAGFSIPNYQKQVGRDELEGSIPVPGEAWSLNLAADGAVLVAAIGDGTIRWFAASGTEAAQGASLRAPLSRWRPLLTLFAHADRRRWVAFTPSGFYATSVAGEGLLGWQVDRPGHVADFFPAPRFRERYYRPDVVRRVLPSADPWKALAQANEEAGRRQEESPVPQRLPPVVSILAPADDAVVEGEAIELRVALRSPSATPSIRLRVMIDGRAIALGEDGTTAWDPQGFQVRTLRVPVPRRDCTVSVVAQSAELTSSEAYLRLRSAAASQGGDAFVIKPNLYILAVGVGAYQSGSLRLGYPAKDARDLVASLRAQQGRLYGRVQARLLTDQEARRGAILEGLAWLRREVTDKDVALLFLAGHGIDDPGSGQYYFLPQDADVGKVASTTVPDVLIRQTLSELPGKVLLFLDTCHAGRVYSGRSYRGTRSEVRFINELASAENGVAVLAASTGRQAAQEDRRWGNGAFTKAVVEGLRGKADYRRTGRITLNMLELYISERVKALTGGTQTPVTAKPASLPDFPVAVLK